MKYGSKTAVARLDKEELCERNTANINLLNNFGETATFLADREMQHKHGWQNQIGKIVTYDMIAEHNNPKNKEYEKGIKELRRKEFWEKHFDQQHKQQSKMRSSLNLATFKAPVRVPAKVNMSHLSREIRNIVNTDAMGKLDSTVGLRYQAYKRSL